MSEINHFVQSFALNFYICLNEGAEIIHLGHNRSVYEIVEAAIEEDVQGIAITSYQGGHLEFFKYMIFCFAQKCIRILHTKEI